MKSQIIMLKNVEEHLSVGDEVDVKVLSIADDGKISLSIKKAKGPST
ncbi:RNA binding protein, contains ribosomal protein S1 domain [Staphylococcus aureus]|uniref:RNA binding protein, contains ribosomal protein S1 domain n=1 Tax=Staphylococcus aureus TaxID=1280 RepID=A0A380DM40_STAAU|nr:RNA binding protein, contains ribosomal protein S1 domain [Staphylococcus aureus]